MAQAAAQRKPVQSADTDFSQLFKDFHSRHRDADGNKLKFTAFFNSLLDALIGNSELQLWMRAIIWVVRYSWGNNTDFAVSQIKGPPVHQQDFAQRVGIDKRRASEVFAEAEAKGYLTSKGNLLYPVDQPAQTAKSNQNDQKSDEGALFPDFDSPFLRWCEEEWKTMSSADFQALQDAEATVRRIRLVRLGLWRQVKKARTSGEPIIIDKTSITIKSNPHPPLPEFPTETPKAEEEESPPQDKTPEEPPQPPTPPIEEAKQAYPPERWDDQKAREAYAAHIRSPEQHRILVEGIARHKASARWNDQEGRWIPLASNFIAKRQYEYDPPPKLTTGKSRNGPVYTIYDRIRKAEAAAKAKAGGAS